MTPSQYTITEEKNMQILKLFRSNMITGNISLVKERFAFHSITVGPPIIIINRTGNEIAIMSNDSVTSKAPK